MKRAYRLSPLQEKKVCIWSGKFMARYRTKGYNILLIGNIEKTENYSDDTKDKGVIAMFKMI